VESIKQAKSSLVSRILDLAGTLTEKDLIFFQGISSEQAAGPEVIIPVFFSRGSPFNEIQARFINYFTRKFEQHNLRLETPMWSSENPLLPVRQKMKEVFGCIVLALERLQSMENTYKKGSPKEEKYSEEYFPTPWIQMEAAMAYQEELPLLIFSEAKLRHEGMIELGVHEFRIFKINPERPEELDEEFFDHLIQSWADKVCKLYNQRRNKRG
jgi:hypothetical protein